MIQGPPGTGKTYIGLKVRCDLGGGRGKGGGGRGEGGGVGAGKTYIGLKVRCGLGGRGEGWGLVDGADQGVRCDSSASRDGENVHWAEGKMWPGRHRGNTPFLRAVTSI